MSNKNQTKQGGKKKPSLLIILIVLVGFAATGAAGYFWSQLQATKAQLNDDHEPKNKKKVEPPVAVTPIYIPLDTFTVSLMPTQEESDRVLYIGLTLKVSNEHSKELIEKFLPDLRSQLLVMFSQRTYTELSSKEGKALLIKLIKDEVNKPVYENQSAGVEDVLLNAFILR